jgi:glycerophosphoryl diester phosphodiesterase
LDEVFSLAAKGTFDFNIETKMSSERPEWTPDPETYARLVLEVIRKHKLEKRVIVQSFDYRTLQATKKLAPEIRLAALNERPFRNMVDAAREAGAGIASPHYRLMNKESVKRAHDAGLLVIPWTANTPDAWEACIDAGVDAIITDDPGELIAYLKKKGLR